MKRTTLKRTIYFHYFGLLAIAVILAGCETWNENPLEAPDDADKLGGDERDVELLALIRKAQAID